MNTLLGKIALITGASRGIGAETAIYLAKHGTDLMLHGRDQKALLSVKEKCEQASEPTRKIKVATVLGDTEEDKTIGRIVDSVRENFGGLDIFFHNAGYKHEKDDAIHKGGSIEAMDGMYRVNIRAGFQLVQQLIPDLEKSKGCVINCSSSASTVIVPRLLCYSVQKEALNHLTRIMALSLAEKNIRVNAICPGYVRTAMLPRVLGEGKGNHWYDKMAKFAPLGQDLPTTEEIAGLVAFLASDMARSITGQTIIIDRGAHMTNLQTQYDLNMTS